MSKSKKIAVCMIAKNCADIIETSLRWATDNFEEVNVVCDTENDDNTLEVLRKWVPKITLWENEFDNFSAQKNRAFSMTTRSWILSVDSDEIYEMDIPWDKLVEGMERHDTNIGAFDLYNIQKDLDHYLLPVLPKPRLMKKEIASMDGKPVDEGINFMGQCIITYPYAHIHFGHVRKESALKLKGKDRIKFIEQDQCDGPGMKEHGEDWFIKRNEEWNRRISECPSQVKETIKRYYE